jgi:putative DNA primase/helicase
VTPARRTYKGAHDWSRRGLLRLGPAGNPVAHIVEGAEDGLSLRQAGATRVLVLCGLYRLGRVELPFETETAAVVRDADAPEAAGTTTLWRGVVRLACQMHSRGRLLVTTRPDAIEAKAKDANDLLRMGGVDKVKALIASAQTIPPFTEFERGAILDAAGDVDNTAYAAGRDRIAALIEWRKIDLDKARQTRIKERATSATIAERDTPWPDPVTDLAGLLDEIVAELSRYVVAPLVTMHAVALWVPFAHLVHREDLKIHISPRLAIQAPDKNCGKSVLLEAIACGVPRPDVSGSISVSSLFRSIHADKCTLLIDEADLMFVGGSNPELLRVLNAGHRRSTAFVKRTERLPDGSFDQMRYNCFTAIALAGIKELPPQLQERSIIIFLQRAVAGEVREHLVNAESEALITIRRKLMRWAEDLRELPIIDRPTELANRHGDNWYPLRQIATLAGPEWLARAWDAATGSTAPPTSSGALTELLDAIWRVFAASKLDRMHTPEIVAALLELDEDKWKYANRNGEANSYYLREMLKDVVSRSPELDRARKWRPSSRPPQWGYATIHLAEAWRRYLGKGPPGEGDSEDDEKAEKAETEAPSEPPSEAAQTKETQKKPKGSSPRGTRPQPRRKR